MCLAALPIAVSARPAFRTAELERLASVLSVDASALHDGYNYQTLNGQKVVIRIDRQQVSHVGLCLFSEDIRRMDQTPVFDFLERYFLQLKYPPVVMTAESMTRDDQFHFLTGSLATVDALLPTDTFSFDYDKRLYTATWSRNAQPLLTVSFPVEYELISGENKIEAENNLIRDIRETKLSDTPRQLSAPDTYIDEHFSKRLYAQDGQLVMSERHPAESAANLMLSREAQGTYDLDLTQVSYGFRKTTFSVPLRQWISFCQNNGCQLYFGIDSIGADGTVSAVVLAVNETENYNHVLTVSIPSDVIAARQGRIEARLYPYVPTHNVMNLFAAYRKSNPKTFVSQ